MLRTIRRAFVPSIGFLRDQPAQGFCVLKANPFWRTHTRQERLERKSVTLIFFFSLKPQEMQSQVCFLNNCFGVAGGGGWGGECYNRSPSWEKAHQ